jgi:hypothetical protein
MWRVEGFDASTGLPDLDEPDPVCLRTVVNGKEIFHADERLG